MVTVRYPAWVLERDTDKRVIVGSYNQTLANKFSRKTRNIVRQRVALSKERTAADDWEIENGGGYRAVGVGAGVTGMGADLIIIDDPVKNRAEANSQAYRDRVWDWYKDDLYTRLEPGGAIVVIQTRWHEDDLTGRLLTSEDADAWHIVNLPGLAEDDDPLGREPGRALCPERYDESALARLKMVLGNSFYALYQQRPTAPDGEFFKRQWFEIVPDAPRIQTRWVRYWDKASVKDGGDYTVGALVGRGRDGTFYVADVVRGQWATGDRENMIRQTAETDAQTYGAVQIVIEQEGGSGGKDSARATIRNLAGFNISTDRPTGDKATRAEPLAAQAQAGNVKIVRGPWNAGYLSELTSFPFGTNDDQVDATSGAFNELAMNAPRRPRVREY
jgi:predicted phage terminase large subunit-like protein